MSHRARHQLLALPGIIFLVLFPIILSLWIAFLWAKSEVNSQLQTFAQLALDKSELVIRQADLGARQFRRRKVDFRRQGFHLVIRHRNGCGVEGVGFDDIRARFKVGVVDSGDHFRFTEYQQVVVAFEVAWPVGKAFTTKIGFVQSIALDAGQNRSEFSSVQLLH